MSDLRTAILLCAALIPSVASAAVSVKAVNSPLDGNGHNVTADGRLFVVTRGGPDGVGWYATVLRPQASTLSNGFPDVSSAFAPWVTVQVATHNENALALCEDAAQPTACDAAGNPNAAGGYACYDLVVIDSDALAVAPNNVLRRRRVKIVVSDPKGPTSAVSSVTWTDTSLTPLSTTLRGIEPTISKDGHLLVWQGRPVNDGQIDTLVYSYNPTACGASGWTAPKTIAAMNTDANLVGKYKLAERPLRAADGTVFSSTQLVYGAYPWLFPDGQALNFTAVNMPCRATDDPPGCGPRRNALSVLGYLTNWTIAHIDGDVNPDTDQTVRLFFTSPGPTQVAPLPATPGVDVWPFFGSNTHNYTELTFDDALDGQYAAVWHLNELVTPAGNFDLTRTADASGYANTGTLAGGASFPTKNNGLLGKAVVLDGISGRVEVPNATSLVPVNQITIQMSVYPAAAVDCDAKNNYRVLLAKGNGVSGSYALVLEDDMEVHGRVRVAGGQIYELLSKATLPVAAWSTVAMEYDAATGTMAMYVDGQETNRATFAPAPLEGLTEKLTIGGPSATRTACPDGNGAFPGLVDEVKISRAWRFGSLPPAPDMAVAGPIDMAAGGGSGSGGGGNGGGNGSDGGTGGSSSGGCSVGAGPLGALAPIVALLLGLGLALALGRRARS